MTDKKPIDEYLTTGSAEESNFRSVILFGRNTASYKFALAKALFDLARQGKDSVTLEQFADPYTRHLVEHVKRILGRPPTGRASSLTLARDM